MTVMSRPRAFAIRKRLDAHFNEVVGVGVATPEPVLWARWLHGTVDLMGPTAPLGWAAPVEKDDWVPEDGLSPLVVPYCPEIIDEQTSHMSEEELDAYLLVVEWVSDRQITTFEDYDSPMAGGLDALEVLKEQYPPSREIYDEMVARLVPQDVDEFDVLVSGLEIDVDMDDILIPSALDDYELARKYEEVRQALLQGHEMASDNPTTARARDLHSERNALLMELRKRGLH